MDKTRNGVGSRKDCRSECAEGAAICSTAKGKCSVLTDILFY